VTTVYGRDELFGRHACAHFLRTQTVLTLPPGGFKVRLIVSGLSLHRNDYAASAAKRAPGDGRQVVSCEILEAVQWQPWQKLGRY
jgi:hypothetical protein